MSSIDEPALPKDFAGTVRLFPLPNLVLFPHVVQPLHIFEPRYREMLEDALASDGLIAMVLLEPGWERDYEGRPAIAPVACLGKVLSHERLAGGKFNLLLRGACRAAIRREHPAERVFRQADVDLLEDFYPASSAARRPRVQRQLVELARELLPDKAAGQQQLDDLLASQVSLGMLTDIFAYTLGFPFSTKQRLLAEWNVDRRARLLADQLSKLVQRAAPPDSPGEGAYPPRFSLN
ncbi:MAG: LON peptidase substrate-binding domain-containing protein [Planctomycetaceae bacterium]|nr:LON peptidase substrate-binding domain-containing protein [Planctomycetaceae bacterium]